MNYIQSQLNSKVMTKQLRTEDFVVNGQFEKVEKLLQHVTLIFNTVLQTSANAVVIFDENGDLVYLNKNGFNMLGISPNDRYEDTINIYKLLDDPVDARRIFLSGEAVEVITSLPIKHLQKDSVCNHFKIRCMSLIVGDQIVAYIGVITDISLHAIQETKIKNQSEELTRLNTIIEHTLHESRVSLWRFFFPGDDYEFIEAEILMGVTNLSFKTHFKDKDFKEIFSDKIYQQFQELKNKHLLPENENKSLISYFDVVSELNNKVANIKIASVCVVAPNGKKEVIAAIHNITDIINQKQELERSNFKLQQLLKGGGLVQWEYDVPNQIHVRDSDANLGLNVPKKVDIDGFISRVHTTEQKEKLRQGLISLVKGESITFDISYAYTPKNTTKIIYLKTYFTPFSFQEDGTVERYIGYTKDITQTQHLIDDLNDAKLRAENADQFKSRFLANMSHEIRTPLNAIVGFSEMLSYARTEDEKEKWQRYIFSNSELLLNLVNDILDLSKIESGNININRNRFDFSPFFNDMSLHLSEKLNNNDVKFIFENPYSKLIIEADKSRMAQVINNYTSNAIKNTTSGSITVGYSFNKKTSVIKFYVKDTGVGISEENQKKLFCRFEKLDNKTQGSGLGLAIVKAILDEVGGDCGCNSELGKGSHFWASNKVKLIEEPILSNKQTLNSGNSPHADKEKYLPDNLNILVAEDNESNFILINSILEHNNITHVKNGSDAVDKAHSHTYDLILMDIRMPIMNGDEAIKAIRMFDTTTPIIVLTANAFTADREYSMSIGATDFIPKPIRRNILLKAINNALS